MGDEGMAIGARAVVHRRAGVARRSAKLTPIGKIKLEGAIERIFFGFFTPRARRRFRSAQARAPGAAFKNRRDATSLYDQPERDFGNLKIIDTSTSGMPIGGESRSLIPNGSNQILNFCRNLQRIARNCFRFA